VITFHIKRIESVWNDISRLSQECWDETESDKHDSSHLMRLDRYKEYEDAGMFYCAVARDGERVVGFSTGFISDCMHTQAKVAVDDGMYLEKPYRGRGVAVRFLRFVEDFCRSLGVSEIYAHATVGGAVPRVLEFLDYEPLSVQYVKRLGRADSARSSIAVSEESSSEPIRPKAPQAA
jgi:GNAT superfamily N-acetyltransferase